MTLAELHRKLTDGRRKYYLSGVDRGELPAESSYSADSSCFVFVVNNTGYCAIEDDNDGYRSSMSDLVLLPAQLVRNRFEPVQVTARMRMQDYDGQGSDILQLVDCANGQVVLEVGTDHADDYYPCFVGAWYPERLSVNEAVAQESGAAVAINIGKRTERKKQLDDRRRAMALTGQLGADES